MNICEPFIRRPVMTTLLVMGLLVFGIIGFFKLPINDLPNIDFPTIQVSASLSGASPETMATAVATPLEKQFSGIAGLDSMTSTSALGKTEITLQFSLDRDIDGAAQDVQAAISAATHQLPDNMSTPPSFKKVNPADAPILYISLRSSTLPLSEVDKYAETLLAQRISMVNGVAQVQVYGSQKYAVRIQLDPNLLAARGISLEQVSQAINNSNVNLPTGSLDGQQQSYLIQANGELQDAAAYNKLIVAYRNGAPVTLDELGTAINSVENTKIASWLNGERGIMLAVFRQPGTNTIQVVNDIKKILPSFADQMPAGIKLKVVYDRSKSIRESVDEVEFTLFLAAVLVVLVIFLFLQNPSAIIIPSLALPVSVIGTFAFMHLADFSLDNISLLALTLAVGYVVDDAIVMLENIYRHLEMGEPLLTAALKGSREINFTILSITLSLVVVFVPILFMGGILGRLLHEFAVTICIAILLSGVVSLTLTPMLASRYLKPPHEQKPSKWRETSERSFKFIADAYERSLTWVLEHRRFTLSVFLASVLLVVILFKVIPKGFFPSEDSGQLFAFTEADPSISFTQMVAKQQIIAGIIQRNPNVQDVISTVGAGGPNSTANTGRLFIHLKSLKERSLSADQIIQQLRNELSSLPGISTYIQNVPSIRIGGRLTKSSYQYTLQSSNLTELEYWAKLFTERMTKLPELQGVTNDLQFTGPQVVVDIDRDKAAALGVTAAAIENTLAYAYGARQVSTIYTSIDTYEVILEVKPEYQQDPNALSKLYVSSGNGTLVPLSTVAHLSRGVGLLTVNHQGQLPAITISFELAPGYSLGDAVSAINQLQAGLNPPATLNASFQGSAQAFQKSLTGLAWLAILAVLVIYIVLGILYESFIHPLTILSGLPSAAVGALLTLILFNNTLNLYSFIGIIMLIGIVKKNAIMMIDFAIDAERREGKAPLEAIYQACLIRFRPIMMTTMAALMGALPIALALGAGAELRRPLGLAVVGGLVVSQLLTLYITPVIYLYLDNLLKRYRRPPKKSADTSFAS